MAARARGTTPPRLVLRLVSSTSSQALPCHPCLAYLSAANWESYREELFITIASKFARCSVNGFIAPLRSLGAGRGYHCLGTMTSDGARLPRSVSPSRLCLLPEAAQEADRGGIPLVHPDHLRLWFCWISTNCSTLSCDSIHTPLPIAFRFHALGSGCC